MGCQDAPLRQELKQSRICSHDVERICIKNHRRSLNFKQPSQAHGSVSSSCKTGANTHCVSVGQVRHGLNMVFPTVHTYHCLRHRSLHDGVSTSGYMNGE